MEIGQYLINQEGDDLATINGVACNMKNLSIDTKHLNSRIHGLDSVFNPVRDSGFEGLVLNLDGHEYTQTAYDAMITEFMRTGSQSLVVRDGWEYRVHSVYLNQVFEKFIVDNYFPYSLSMITDTPYTYLLDEIQIAKQITTNNQEWNEGDIPPHTQSLITGGLIAAPLNIKITSNGPTLVEKIAYSQENRY